MQIHLAWKTLEYEHKPRSSDWFWGLGIIAIAGVILSIFLGNFLFGVVIGVGAVALGLHALRHPHIIECEIQDRGVRIGDTLFPYRTLESFWIDERLIPNRLLLKSQKMFMPHIIVPLADISTDEVRDTLLQYLDEEEVHETFSDRIVELAGF
ncbi:MAG: hypothetical protein NUW02_01255 [Candidatus Campbellbacteria bacterium]|nr:hypothetical protein [Candidatus Campbellbacteria bacterium]